ncbi:hypothetical protein PR048_020168 [Dryococelus australis]|uniref:Uncharacterized protein n=1 Tax=Dryococelus australis TaxID=614101 RepID=A0ABQ9H5J6_9NEOP|nr:hypothetical protein PR048_020168 [Dryococelus australis]
MEINEEIHAWCSLPHLSENLQRILASVTLDKETHTYHVEGREERLYSITQLISTCFKQFNAVLITERVVTIAKWPNSVHFEKLSKCANPAKELGEIWNRENSRKALFGVLFHIFVEMHYSSGRTKTCPLARDDDDCDDEWLRFLYDEENYNR